MSDAGILVFDIVIEMKGHVGGGLRSCAFKVRGDRLKHKPVHGLIGAFVLWWDHSYVSLHTPYVMCRNWLLEVSGFIVVIPLR